MGKKKGTSWRKWEFVFALASTFAVAALLAFAQPSFSGGTAEYPEGRTSFDALPFRTAEIPLGDFSVRLDFSLFPLHVTHFVFEPDDCIDRLEVNGVSVDSDTLPFCDSSSSFTLDLSPYLRSGHNTLRADMRNTAWYSSLNIRPWLFDPLYVFLAAAWLLGMFWFFAWGQGSLLLRKVKRHKAYASAMRVALFAAIASIFVLALYHFFDRLWYELQGPYTMDTPLYWTVGRGIANGYVPYRDLFETKPPGIFLLSAVSVLLTNDFVLTHVFQVLVIAGIPVLLALATLRMQSPKKSSRAVTVSLAALVGTQLALFTAFRSGEVQVESFGAFFGCLYAFFLLGKKHTYLSLAAASAALMIAIGFKEPFLLTCLAGAILLAPSPPALLRTFGIPVVSAAVGGIALLLAFGYADAYALVYLPEMFGRHSGDPIWLRAFDVLRIVEDLSGHSVWLTSTLCVLVVAYCACKFYGREFILWTAAKLAMAAYLISFAVGLAGQYWNHHYAFAVPAYCALALAFFRDSVALPPRVRRVFIVALFLTSAMFFYRFGDPGYDRAIRSMKEHRAEALRTAAVIDDIADRCGVDRYLFIGMHGMQPYAYTEHIPYGPLFFQFHHLIDNDRPYFRETFLRNLDETRLVVQGRHELSDLEPRVQGTLATEFTRTPWQCAGLTRDELPGEYEFFFRTDTE